MNFDLPDKFDLIILYSVFPRIEDKQRCIKKLATLLLIPGGKLAICHSGNREKINAIHYNGGAIISNHMLLPAKKVIRYIKEAGMKVTDALDNIDNEDLYVIIACRHI